MHRRLATLGFAALVPAALLIPAIHGRYTLNDHAFYTYEGSGVIVGPDGPGDTPHAREGDTLNVIMDPVRHGGGGGTELACLNMGGRLQIQTVHRKRYFVCTNVNL